jgi:hypothetical protein
MPNPALILNFFGLNFLKPTFADGTALGTGGGQYQNNGQKLGVNGGNYQGTFATPTPAQHTSAQLGTPVFSRVRLTNPENPNVEYLDLDTVLFEVNLVNNIVSTQITGQKGTFKEYVSTSDFAITAKGVLTNSDMYNRPLIEMKELWSLFQTGKELNVTSDFLNSLDIFSIVISTARKYEQTGFQNMIPFEFTALSDRPIELLLNDETANQ